MKTGGLSYLFWECGSYSALLFPLRLSVLLWLLADKWLCFSSTMFENTEQIKATGVYLLKLGNKYVHVCLPAIDEGSYNPMRATCASWFMGLWNTLVRILVYQSAKTLALDLWSFFGHGWCLHSHQKIAKMVFTQACGFVVIENYLGVFNFFHQAKSLYFQLK